MNYQQVKDKIRNPLNNFEGLFFAFSKSQFKEGMEKIGLTENDEDKIFSIGAGGFILKSKREAFDRIFDDANKALKDFLATPEGLKEALIYELWNHEYIVTGNASDALDALGLTIEEVDKDILREACKIASQESECA